MPCNSVKPSAAYKEFRYDSKKGTRVLVLPRQRTLRDCKNYVRPKRELNQLVEKTKSFTSWEDKIIHNNWKIYSSRFSWHKSNIENIDLNYATLQNAQQLATHILIFMVKIIARPLSYSFATFATNKLTSYQLPSVFEGSVSLGDDIQRETHSYWCWWCFQNSQVLYNV